jgi:hypothetical protein
MAGGGVVLTGVVLAASATASASVHLPDARVTGVIAALTGTLLLSSGLSATSLRGGWRVTAVCAAVAGTAAMAVGAAGFTLDRWMAASAAAAVCSVTGIFGVLRLMVPGIRAQSLGRGMLLMLSPFAAPWALVAVLWAVVPAADSRGLGTAVIPAVTIYVFVWSVLKGLLAAIGNVYEENPPPASAVPALTASLRGDAVIAGAVAAALGLAAVLVHATGASAETRGIVWACLGLGPIVLAVLTGLACRMAPDLLSLAALIGVLLAAKAAVLLVIPAFMDPAAVLIAGGACLAAGLTARLLPVPAVVFGEDAAGDPDDTGGPDVPEAAAPPPVPAQPNPAASSMIRDGHQ